MQVIPRGVRGECVCENGRGCTARGGKWSAELYVYETGDESSGRRKRLLRATGIRLEHGPGWSQSKRTAETIGRKYEAELNGVHGETRARQVRRSRSITLVAAYTARTAQIRAKGKAEASVGITQRSSVHPLRYFGPDRDLDLDPLQSTHMQEYAAYALERRAASTVHREILELRCGLAALNAGFGPPEARSCTHMPLLVPKRPDLPDTEAPVELWLDADQSRLLYECLPEAYRDHYLMHRCLGLSYGELYKITPEDVHLDISGRGLDIPARVRRGAPASEASHAGPSVRVRGTKRRQRDRVLPLPPQLERLLASRLKWRAAVGLPLFAPWPQPQGMLTRAARRAGIVPMGYREGLGRRKAQGSAGGQYSQPWRITVNVLRASFCTELVWADVHPSKIAELMGHNNTRTAQRWYTRLRSNVLGDVVGLISDPSARSRT